MIFRDDPDALGPASAPGPGPAPSAPGPGSEPSAPAPDDEEALTAERELRAGLLSLADEPPAPHAAPHPSPPAGAARTLAVVRTRRRRGRALRAGLATVVVLAAAGGTMSAFGPLLDRDAERLTVAEAPSPTPTLSPVTEVPTAVGLLPERPPVPSRTDPRDAEVKDPADPKPGKRYPHDLNTHCEIHYTYFAGRAWEAVDPRPDPYRTLPMPDYGQLVRGWMTLISSDHALFEAADFEPVEFRLMTKKPPPCK